MWVGRLKLLRTEFNVTIHDNRGYALAGKIRLDAENPDYPNIEINDDPDLIVWGVVRASVHQFRK